MGGWQDSIERNTWRMKDERLFLIVHTYKCCFKKYKFESDIVFARLISFMVKTIGTLFIKGHLTERCVTWLRQPANCKRK